MEQADVDSCCSLSLQVAKIDRSAELRAKWESRGAKVVIDANAQVVAYTLGLDFIGHSVAASVEAMQYLIANQDEDTVFLVPTEQTVLLQWLLTKCKSRLVKSLCLMCYGDYEAPNIVGGVYLPTSDY